VSRDRPPKAAADADISIEIGDLYNLHDLSVTFPTRQLSALTGPSGAGKTALILDSLVPAARARLSGDRVARSRVFASTSVGSAGLCKSTQRRSD